MRQIRCKHLPVNSNLLFECSTFYNDQISSLPRKKILPQGDTIIEAPKLAAVPRPAPRPGGHMSYHPTWWNYWHAKLPHTMSKMTFITKFVAFS